MYNYYKKYNRYSLLVMQSTLVYFDLLQTISDNFQMADITGFDLVM